MTNEVDSDASAPQLYLVIGASGGIGSEVCRKLAGSGRRVALAARNLGPVEDLAQSVNGFPYEVEASDFADVDRLFDDVARDHGPLAGVVHCVGSLLLKPAHATTREQFDAVIGANLTSAFATVRAAGRVMRKTGGSLVLVSSAAASIGLPSHEAIAAAKAGVAGLTLSAAATYAPGGLRVNAVAPGLVDTPLTSSIFENPIARQASTGLHPMGRLGTPADVASLIVWLLGDESAWVTGQVWGVDGGLASLKARASR